VQSDWDAAYNASADTSSDQRLIEAARWLAAEAAAVRTTFANPVLDGLSPEWSTILAIAALNREYRTAVELAVAEAEKARADGMLAADAVAGLRINGGAGQRFTVADLAEAGTDATENWLFDAARATGLGDPASADLAPAAVLAIKAYSFRKALNVLWNDVWFSGWYVHAFPSGETRWIPSDRAGERLLHAWRSRQEANLMNFPNIDRMAWPQLTPAMRRKRARKSSVVEISRNRKGLRFKVGNIGYLSKRMPAYMYEKGMLEGSYVADFVETKMPADNRLSIALLQQGWHVIYDIAKLMAKRVPLPTTLTPEHARQLALAVDRSLLIQAIEKALQAEPSVATAIVDFLTFAPQTGGKAKAKGNKGLWAAPLVPVPGSNEMLLPLPVLATSNPARRAEAWLEKGGINDDNPTVSRGDRFEKLYREKVCQAIAGNKLLPGAASAPNGVANSKLFSEQIDLLVAFGGLCLVGEVKFFLMPVDAHERDRYDVKLSKAAEQARRKATALTAGPDIIASALGIDVARAAALQLLPIVVTNQGFGFSTRVNGTLVVEAEFLRNYLGAGNIVTGMALVPATGRSALSSTTLYTSEEMAAREFEATMSAPYVLTRFLDRVRWSEITMLTLAHPPSVREVPVLKDVSGLDRMRAEPAIAELS
jgi:hypothetical protein